MPATWSPAAPGWHRFFHRINRRSRRILRRRMVLPQFHAGACRPCHQTALAVEGAALGPVPLIVVEAEGEPDSCGEAFSEGNQQLRRPFDADAPAQQGPQQASLFCQETQPRLTVGGHTQIGLALVALLDLQGAVLNRDGGLLALLWRKLLDLQAAGEWATAPRSSANRQLCGLNTPERRFQTTDRCTFPVRAFGIIEGLT